MGREPLPLLNPTNPPDKHNLPSMAHLCSDGDAACDFNAVPGWCGFEMVVCANTRDPNLGSCAASGIDSIELKSPRLQSGTSAGASALNAARTIILDALTHLADPLAPGDGFVKQAPIAADQRNLCSRPFRVDVPTAAALGRSHSSGIKVKTKSQRNVFGSTLKQNSQLKLVCLAPAG